MNDSTTLGLIEIVFINGKKLQARIDTGASRSSIDMHTVADLQIGPIVKNSTVVSAHGKTVRPVVFADIEIGGKKMKSSFNIMDRSNLKYKILIGRNILKRGFLIDPKK